MITNNGDLPDEKDLQPRMQYLIQSICLVRSRPVLLIVNLRERTGQAG